MRRNARPDSSRNSIRFLFRQIFRKPEQKSLQKTKKVLYYYCYADMVELADTQDLGSCAAMRAGSTPVIRTKKKSRTKVWLFFFGSLHSSLFVLLFSLLLRLFRRKTKREERKESVALLRKAIIWD